MNIKVTQFCGLSTSPQWQAWLYKYSTEVYGRFVSEMQKSKGCNQNRDIMLKFFNELEEAGAKPLIIDFLKMNFPYMLEDEVNPEVPVQIVHPPEVNELQTYKNAFSSGNVTFPHRALTAVADKTVDELMSGFMEATRAIAVQHIVIDGILYVEYLLPADASIKDILRTDQWLVPKMSMLVGNESTDTNT